MRTCPHSDDARRTNRDVATAVGVAPTTALDPTRALRDRGVITGARLEVDLAAIGRPVQALVAIRIRPPTRTNIERFRSWASGLPETLGVFVTSGTEDFLLHLAVPGTDSLYAFVVDRLTSRPEVSDVRTSVVYEHLRGNVLPPVRQGKVPQAVEGRFERRGAVWRQHHATTADRPATIWRREFVKCSV